MTQTYPNQPGWKRPGTSEEAADSMRPTAGTLRAKVLAELERAPGTADDICARLNISILAGRPRVSELENQGLIRNSGERGKSHTGRSAIIWEANPR